MTFEFPHVVLLLWVPFSLGCFFIWRPTAAAVFVMLGGMLFLPERAFFDGPGIPPIGKREIAALSALVGCLLFARGRLARARPGRGLDLLVLVLMAGAYFTARDNPEPLVNGPTVRPGLTQHDALSMAIADLFEIALPFLLGRALFERARDLKTLGSVLVGLGLVYSLFMLVEIRLSPQLHNWIYGYHAHEFQQTFRWGGYRPTVFMAHGLAVGLFALVVAMQAATRLRLQRSAAGWLVLGYCLLMLVACKSTGSILVGLVLVPLALWARPRRQLRVAALIAAICFAYPLAKLGGAVPDAQLVELAKKISPERAASLAFRFANDEELVARAKQKLVFGWGGYGRPQVFTEWGQNKSVTDGDWIVRLGARGLVGLFAAYIILLFPIWRALRALPALYDRQERLLLAGLGLVVAAYAFDLMPNGLFTNVPFFFAGALLRLAKEMPRAARAAEEQAIAWPGSPVGTTAGG